jgi:hypothetical protein
MTNIMMGLINPNFPSYAGASFISHARMDLEVFVLFHEYSVQTPEFVAVLSRPPYGE